MPDAATATNSSHRIGLGKDHERCPKCQSEELFVSLYRARDTPTELILYAGETHSFLGTGTRRSARMPARGSSIGSRAMSASLDRHARES